MTVAASYSQQNLENNYYYDEEHRVRGEWHGRGAELLGLKDEVTRDQFQTVRQGLNPKTGEFLRPRHSAERISSDGNEQGMGRSLYDLTFAAPTSLSSQALVGGDGRLIAAHDIAVDEALAVAETLCGITREAEWRKRQTVHSELGRRRVST
jgi:conjugative relaxase-like TrwC/TraI family protein